MKILDRYVLISFIKNYLIAMMVLLGLYIVLDMVFNFDKLADAQEPTEVIGTVRQVSKGADNSVLVTLDFARTQNLPRGLEFKIFDPAGKGIGSMTIASSSGHESTGAVTQTRPGDVRIGDIARGLPPPLSTMTVIDSIVDYYAHQSFLFFVQLSGVIPVVAAAFTLIRMSRFNELTAILAAGVPLLRVSLPIIYCGVALNFILLPITQEIVIPSMIPELTRKQDELQNAGDKSFPVRAMQDDNNSLLNAGRYTPPDGKHPAHLEVVDVILRDNNLRVSSHISADSADFDPTAGQWNLVNGSLVKGLGMGETRTAGEPIAVWKTNISPQEIALYHSGDFVDLLSTDNINQLLQRPKSYGTIALLRVKHFRWTQLLINIVLLLLAIPCVLTREPGTLKTDILKCVILTGACMASIFMARQIAANPPMTGNWVQQWPLICAWIPIFIFLPLALYLLDQKHTKKT